MRAVARPPPGGRGVALIWEQLAGLLAEQSEEPLFVVDERGVVRLFNHPMERITGWQRPEIVGHPWRTLAARDPELDPGGDWLTGVLLGVSTRVECEIFTRPCDRMRLALQVSVVASPRRRRFVLARVVDARLLAPRSDLVYEIDTSAERFGRLRGIARLGAAPVHYDRERYCFEVLHQRSSPCAHCPLTLRVPDGQPRAAVRRIDDESGVFEIITATPVGGTAARLSVRSLTPSELLLVTRARVGEIVRLASLSERERAVFDSLLLGRSLRDIAQELKVSVRTIRFHQENVLRKIGAESKADILRVLL